MKRLMMLFALLLCLAAVGVAQDAKPAVQAFGGITPDDRGSTRVLYWDTVKNVPLGQLAIDFGRPLWKKEYENQALFDGFTKGKVWRLGNNFWTTLDTALPLKIAGKEVAPGSYYLGLHRSADGATWSLAFIDPVKVRQAQLDAFVIDKAPIEFTIPVSAAKAASTADKLTVLLTTNKANLKEVTLTITWGTLQLSAPIQVAVQM
ncbi:MAG: DUF2911 domain-containing protein [Acidobacteria bacterium]|nr:DUF2911 domain-containing protein [Acidobacteriota bacterium]